MKFCGRSLEYNKFPKERLNARFSVLLRVLPKDKVMSRRGVRGGPMTAMIRPPFRLSRTRAQPAHGAGQVRHCFFLCRAAKGKGWGWQGPIKVVGSIRPNVLFVTDEAVPVLILVVPSAADCQCLRTKPPGSRALPQCDPGDHRQRNDTYGKGCASIQ